VTYLGFLSVYNMLNWPLEATADARFFGWLPAWLAVFLVLADAWMRTFSRGARVMPLPDDDLFYRYVPMAMLLLYQTSYFVARGVDYTLVMALLAFCALAAPAGLAFTVSAWSARGAARVLAVLPPAVLAWTLSFVSFSLLREQTPYSLIVHECRDLGRCSPGALAAGLGRTLQVRGVLERVRRPSVDAWFDTQGVVRETVTMIDTLAGDQPEVTVLIGQLPGALPVSEIALMYSGRWHRWPRSYTLTDEYVPRLVKRIVESPVHLREGELVVVRRDETALGPLERDILNRIRADSQLCPVPNRSVEIVPYRVAGAAGCRPERP
jgi:hypothetical protein